jgi:acyl-CoA thioesterase I
MVVIGRPIAARRRLVCACVLVTAVCAGVVGSASARAAPASAAVSSWSIVTLGDSVPRGTNCRCAPFPELAAERLSRISGRIVIANNDSVAGYTTANVLRQLTSDEPVVEEVRGARAVEVEIGANDVPYRRSCGAKLACYASGVPAMKARLTAIVNRVRALTSGRRVGVVLVDYWSIWLGGRYAAARGSAYVAVAEEMTDRVDTAIKQVAATTGAGYVDLRTAFKGRTYAYDESHYLSSDGDHPNAAGHKQIALAVESALKTALHL